MKYQEPELTLIYFQEEDVVKTSGEHSDWDSKDDNVVGGWTN